MENVKRRYLRLAEAEYSESNTDIAHFKQQRGRELERLIGQALRSGKLAPRLSFRPRGEEVDGSFILDGRVFLLEAKWKSKPTPASEIYAFKGKVDGKFLGTAGLFISVSGYSPDCIEALRFGKSLNVLLADGTDLESSLGSRNDFRDMVRAKVRHASETGEPFYPYVSMGVDINGCDSEKSIREPVPTPTNELLAPGAVDLVLVVEGDRERALVCSLASKVLVGQDDCPRLAVIAAQGKRNVASIANVVPRGENPPQIVIIVNGDDDVESARELVESSLLYDDVTTIIVESGVEQWGNKSLGRRASADVERQTHKNLVDQVKRRGEVRVLLSDESFRKLFELLLSRKHIP